MEVPRGSGAYFRSIRFGWGTKEVSKIPNFYLVEVKILISNSLIAGTDSMTKSSCRTQGGIYRRA
ncbi:MAG: hypothetical protein ACP5PT_08900 [Brevinematia bacterium]